MDDSQENNNIFKKEKRSILVISCAFTSVFTAFTTIQNLQSSLNAEGSIGIISLLCVYVSCIISAVLTPAIIRILSPKKSMIIAFLVHTVYSGCNFYPTFWTMVPSSLLLGLATGPLWTAQGMYFSTCSYSSSKRKNKPVEIILTKFYGIFIVLMALPHIIGNLLSSLILREHAHDLEGNGTISNSSSIDLQCGVNVCPGEKNEETLKVGRPDNSTIYILMGAFVIFDLIGLLLVTFVLPASPANTKMPTKSISSTAFSCFTIMADFNFTLLLPLMLTFSSTQSFQWVDIPQAYISCPIGIRMIGFILSTRGVLYAVSGAVASRVTKLVGRKAVFVVLLLTLNALYIVMIFWSPSDNGVADIIGIIIIVCIHGVIDGMLNIQMSALITNLYPDKIDSAFSSYNGWKAIGHTTYITASYFLCVQTKIISLIVLTCVALVSYIALEIRIYKGDKRTEETDLTVKENLK